MITVIWSDKRILIFPIHVLGFLIASLEITNIWCYQLSTSKKSQCPSCLIFQARLSKSELWYAHQFINFYFKGEPILEVSSNAFFLFYKSLVKRLNNIFLKFQSGIRSPSDAIRTSVFQPFSIRNFKCVFHETRLFQFTHIITRKIIDWSLLKSVLHLLYIITENMNLLLR